MDGWILTVDVLHIYVRNCCVKLHTPLCIFTMNSTLCKAIYNALIVYRVISMGSSMNITWFIAWVIVLTICS